MTHVLTQDKLRDILERAFRPLSLEVIDDSAKHAGHRGHAGSGNSHFQVRVVSEVFTGVARVERHRMIYKALDDYMGVVHALAITALDPTEGS